MQNVDFQQEHLSKRIDLGDWLRFSSTAQKMKFPIKDFFNKYDQIRRKLRIWLNSLKKTLMESFIFYAVFCIFLKKKLCTFYVLYCRIRWKEYKFYVPLASLSILYTVSFCKLQERKNKMSKLQTLKSHKPGDFSKKP